MQFAAPAGPASGICDDGPQWGHVASARHSGGVAVPESASRAMQQPADTSPLPGLPAETGTEAGLSRAQAAERLARDGPNELPSSKPRSVFAIAASIVREPIFLLLIACGAIYLLLGDKGEALMLMGFVLVVIAIAFVQERKAERALEALRDLSSPRALVLRGGEAQRIAGREVVRGDLLLLAEGDRVPADAVLVAGKSLSADESLLTGESVPVAKLPATIVPEAMSPPGGDGSPFLFSGTMIVQGKGSATVVATGGRTALGRIGRSLASLVPEPSRIQTETARIVKRLAALGLALSALVALWYGATRGDWLHGLLAGITLAMAILPEELPVVLTLFLGLGAWRIAQHGVLTRHIPALEMLGSATVLCVDKTGTLTQNRMALSWLWAAGQALELAKLGKSELPESFHETVEFALLASHRDPFDPMEKAIHEAAARTLEGTEHLHGDWTFVSEYPLSPDLMAMSRVWRSPDLANCVIASKGAPEAVFDLCHLDAAMRKAISGQVDALAARGLRVLGVARAAFSATPLPPIQHDFAFEFLGLIGLADPVREAVPAAIAESYAAGIRVIMITGDYPATAAAIAREIGLRSPQSYVTGQQFEALDDAELARRVAQVDVYCRALPEQKLRIVEALKANGDIVAMTGDGVNDAPALRSAHIGIAMGGRGTDVARESAALVLLDDDFSSIVTAVRFGRRIFDNLRKAFCFVIAVHLPIIGISVIPLALGWPLLLMPVHILFLQLIIDPACSIVFEAEPEEAGAMRRPPRAPASSLFDRDTVALGFLQGLVVLAVLLAMYGVELARNHNIEEARALAFATMVLASLGLILSGRSRVRGIVATFATPNPALWWVVGGALALLAAILALPALRGVFRFGVLHPVDVAIAILAAGVCTAACEAAKRLSPSGAPGART
jgi:Ca2+-transporting ATPase